MSRQEKQFFKGVKASKIVTKTTKVVKAPAKKAAAKVNKKSKTVPASSIKRTPKTTSSAPLKVSKSTPAPKKKASVAPKPARAATPTRVEKHQLKQPAAGDNVGVMLRDKGTGKIPSSNTKVIELPEKTAPQPVKPQDATKKWEEFLGEGEYSNIHPIKGTPDPNRIFSANGKRSIRYGNHEMGSKPTKHHYHEEIWDYDPIKDTMTYSNTIIRVPVQR